MANSDYKVDLDIYSGPLDLLLHLIKQEEVDIYDIPISRVTEQYLLYVEALRAIDINLAGDFLVMASRLMEIKAKMLAPEAQLEEEAEEEDPRLELVRQLIEYKRFKEAARDLEDLATERALRFGRPGEKHEEEQAQRVEEKDLLSEASIWDLLNAFSRLMKATGLPTDTTIVYDDIPTETHMQLLLQMLREKKSVSFFDLFTDRTSRIAIIGTFLALLELVRLRQIRAEQPTPFGDIRIVLREDPPTPPVPQASEPFAPVETPPVGAAPQAAEAAQPVEAPPTAEAPETPVPPAEEPAPTPAVETAPESQAPLTPEAASPAQPPSIPETPPAPTAEAPPQAPTAPEETPAPPPPDAPKAPESAAAPQTTPTTDSVKSPETSQTTEAPQAAQEPVNPPPAEAPADSETPEAPPAPTQEKSA